MTYHGSELGDHEMAENYAKGDVTLTMTFGPSHTRIWLFIGIAAIVVSLVVFLIYYMLRYRGGKSSAMNNAYSVPLNWYHYDTLKDGRLLAKQVTPTVARQAVGTKDMHGNIITSTTWEPLDIGKGEALGASLGNCYYTTITDWMEFINGKMGDKSSLGIVRIDRCGFDIIGNYVPRTYYSTLVFGAKQNPSIANITTPYGEEYLHTLPAVAGISAPYSSYVNQNYSKPPSPYKTGVCKGQDFYFCPIFWEADGFVPTYTVKGGKGKNSQVQLYLHRYNTSKISRAAGYAPPQTTPYSISKLSEQTPIAKQWGIGCSINN